MDLKSNVPPSSGKGLVDDVVATLRHDILAGKLAPGERLNVARLATTMGISHIPIREAVRWLEAEGLVITVPRVGAVVSEVRVEELHEIYELRRLIEIDTLQGYELDPGVVVPENTQRIEISETGIVSAYVAGDTLPVELGQLSLTSFVNDAGLHPMGNNLLQASAASGDPVPGTPGGEGLGVIRQGYLENSNVDIIRQITDLIRAQRAYEMNAKAIETADQMMSTANQVK